MAFWNKQRESAVIEPQPQPIAVSVPDSLESYISAAKAAGITDDSPIIAEARLVDAIKHNNISCYDYDAVDMYLRKQMPNGWSWTPLGQSDSDDRNTFPAVSNWYFGAITPRRLYNKPVPLPVLNTVAILRDAVGTALRCYVSDELENWGDPFLMVRVHLGQRVFIVERWDEPGFRDKR